jgi:ferredoxin
MKATIDHDGCISCGMCIDICPDIFRMGNDEKAEVYGEINASNEDSAKEARDSCPVSVISIEE